MWAKLHYDILYKLSKEEGIEINRADIEIGIYDQKQPFSFFSLFEWINFNDTNSDISILIKGLYHYLKK